MNWKKVISMNKQAVVDFANGTLPKNSFYSEFTGTDIGGAVRNYIRENGTEAARKNARAALNRRGIKA